MLFSILVANYNNGHFFKDFYDSMLKQQYENWELVIVDDCSTDDSVSVINAIIGNDRRVRFYENEVNRGCGFTKNRCAALASGEVGGFVDPDDALTPGALQKMIEAHQAHTEVALVHSTFYYCNDLLQPQHIYERAGTVVTGAEFTNLEGKVNHFAAFKLSLYKKTPGIDQTFLRAVDQDLYLKMAEQGSFYFISEPLYYYRIHSQGISISAADQAFYWFLKAISKAEERRNVNLEKQVAAHLNRTDPVNMERKLANPRFLLLNMFSSFKKKPASFLKRLFLNKD